jgi:hypothetical protein
MSAREQVKRVCSKTKAMMKENLGRCAEQLRYAVHHLANGSGTPQGKLTSMYNETTFGRICQDDFLDGSLKNDYLTITGLLVQTSRPQAVANIAAMSDEQARKTIAQICSLSEAVAYALGRQSNSE